METAWRDHYWDAFVLLDVEDMQVNPLPLRSLMPAALPGVQQLCEAVRPQPLGRGELEELFMFCQFGDTAAAGGGVCLACNASP